MAEKMDDGSDGEVFGLEPVAAPPQPAPGSGLPFPDLPKPARRGAGPAIPFDPLGYSSIRSLPEVPVHSEMPDVVGGSDRRRGAYVPKFTTLESMYSQNPELQARGTLRVERVQPQWHSDGSGHNMRVCGILAFNHPIISTSEFTQKFGGYKYRIYGMLEQENHQNRGGPPQQVDLAVAEFEVPVPPNLMNLPLADGENGIDTFPTAFSTVNPMMQSPYGRQPGGAYPYAFYQTGAQAPQPQQENLNPVLGFAERMLNRAGNQGQQQSLPAEFFHAVGEQSRSAQDNIRQVAQTQAQLLERQLEMTQRQLDEERKRASEAQNRPTDVVQMVGAMSQLVQAQKGGADSDVMRQLRDDHERAIRHLKEEAERSLLREREQADRTSARLAEEQERAISRERESHDMRLRLQETRVADLEKTLERRERELREEAERRERSAREEMTRQIDARDREATRRMSDMKEAHARELQNLQTLHDRELRMKEDVYKNTSQTSTQAHAIEMRGIQTDLAKMSGELEEKRRIVEESLADKNKPLLAQVKELQEMSSALQELAGGSASAGEGAAPGDQKWFNMPIVQELGKAIISKGADLIPKLAEAAKGQQQGMPGQQMQQMPNQLPPGYPQQPRARAGLPPRPRPRMTFSDPDGTPVVGITEHLPSQQPSSQDIGAHVTGPRQFAFDSPQGMPVQMAQQPMQQPQRTAPAPSFANYVAPPTPRAPAQPPQPLRVATSPAAAGPGAPAEQGDPWAAFAWLPMGREQVETFITQLNSLLLGGQTPAQVTDSICQAYTVEQLSMLPTVIDVKRLIESIRMSPATKGSMLATGKGRRFLMDIWGEITRRVQGLAAQKQDAPEQEQEQPAASEAPDSVEEAQPEATPSAPAAEPELKQKGRKKP